MRLVAPESGPVFILQRGNSMLQHLVERILRIAHDERFFGDTTDVIGDVGDADDDENGDLPGGQMAPEGVAVSIDQRGHERRRHDWNIL